MKKPLITVVLLATSAAAFGLGWALRPLPQTSPDNDLLVPGMAHSPSGANLQSLDGTLTSPRGDENKLVATEGAFAAYVRKGGISADDMGSAIKNLTSEKDPLKRRAMFTELLNELTPENAVAAYDALREARGRSGRGGRGGFGGFGGGDGDEMRLLLNAWGRVDGAGAAAELQAREQKRREEWEARRAEAEGSEGGGEGGEGDRRRGGRGGFAGRDGGRGGFGGRGGGSFDLSSVVNGWATVDSSGASEFVNSIEDERQKGMLSGSLLQGMLVNGVDDALAFVTNLPADDENRGRHISTIAGEVMREGVEGAANWVSTLADDDLKGSAMNRIAESYARENIDAAVAWAAQHAGNDYANRAVSEVAERWAESDPQAVIDWASSLPESAQAGVWEEALDEWTEKDPLAASEYLAKMPDSAAKNSAIEGFATELSREDGESAVTWAQTITDPEMRTQTLERVARDWYRQDQDAASEWLLTSGLPEESIAKIAEPSERGRGDWGRGGGRGGRGR